MNMKSARTREIRISFSLAAIVYLVLGVLLVLMPNTSRRLLCMLVGAGVTVYGLLNILSYMLGKGEHAYTPALLLGVCALAFGVFSLIHPTFLMDFLFTVIALIVLIASINGIRRALRLRSLGFIRWWAALTSPLCTLALSLSILFMPGLYGDLLMMLCGVLLAANGVSDLISLHVLSGYVNR
ncbi:MAG: DUF308 domain-containing protein [Clostridia bacterium]|nr:DUF308 domain-containing protein [Clostridia bacterium]